MLNPDKHNAPRAVIAGMHPATGLPYVEEPIDIDQWLVKKFEESKT